MPAELNGTYYTMKETAKLLGLNFTGLARVVKDREEIVKLGTFQLVPEYLVEELINTYGKLGRAYPVVADMLDTDENEIRAIVANGFPSVLDTKGNPAISSDVLPFLQASYSHIKGLDVPPIKRPKVVASLAMKLMAALETENV